MKYYVVSDVHSFYNELIDALTRQGFFEDTEPHKLIICGDAFDRGIGTVELQRFMMELLAKDELIFVRGNHEDLLIDMIVNFDEYRLDIESGFSHHVSNGTFKTALHLAGMTKSQAFRDTDEFRRKVMQSDFWKVLIPASVNYYETDKHIFVHGHIPCVTEKMPMHYRLGRTYRYMPEWRNAADEEWSQARWFNGMELAMLWDIIEDNKSIVVGHWHASYGHSKFDRNGTSEFGSDADFSPFYGRGIIAVDACTAYSGKVNCIVIEDE